MPTLIDKHGNLDYFGKLSWGNLVDWIITLCLGCILVLTTLLFGAVRPDTQLLILPLFALLLALHGLWFLVEKETPKRISRLPFLFIPFVLWAGLNSAYISPTPWLGWLEWIAIAEVFIFLWVLANNVRTRSHLWALIVLAVSPAAIATFIGFYQFFQNPDKIVSAGTDYGLHLSEKFVGQATGSFGDPNSFAALLLVLLPCFFIAGFAPRLPIIHRILCLYLGVIFAVSVFFTQMVWPLVALICVSMIVPWFSFNKMKYRFIFSTVALLSTFAACAVLFFFSPSYKRIFEEATTIDGEGVRLVLWEEALRVFSESPIVGSGAGSFQQQFEQSPSHALKYTPFTPHNDYLLILSNFGLLGALLLFGPAAYVLFKAYQAWRVEPFKVQLKDKKAVVMPPRKFFLSTALSGVIIFSLCATVSFILYAPALSLYAVLFFAIAIKLTFSRALILPGGLLSRFAYFVSAIVCAVFFYQFASPKLGSRGKELRANQQLTQILERRVHISGDAELLDEVIDLYEEAIALDLDNCDAWIGLSTATCQLYFRNPAEFSQIAARAIEQAEKAEAITENYWQMWAQLGLSHALSGDRRLAEGSLRKALEMAPNSSNANFYWASYLAASPETREAAIMSVERALEINPNNSAARRLQQKLLIR